MTNKELIDIIFTHPNIDKYRWIFRADIDWNEVDIKFDKYFIIWRDGVWRDGTWEYGLWRDGSWVKGIWNGGTWIKGSIYDHKLNKYRKSKLPPNECKWGSSYGK